MADQTKCDPTDTQPAGIPESNLKTNNDPKRETFQKTLALYGNLLQEGCGAASTAQACLWSGNPTLNRENTVSDGENGVGGEGDDLDE
ncbi:hypothetical protein FRB99_001959 [Tulasnella sp. 403]|nr:hypothetical protein FRB99_001959 [Tulasnella sp. 403]